MNKLESVILATAAAVGSAMVAGCGPQGTPAGTSSDIASVQPATAIGASSTLLLRPGRDHDITSADLSGTVQFRILTAPTGALEDGIAAAASYTSDDGKTIGAQSEVSLIKGTASLIATVRSSAPLEPAKWYTLQVATGRGLDVSDPERVGADQQWRMRLYTGSDPQIVAVKSTGTHIQVSFSEPVNVAATQLAITSDGKPPAGCFETASGCVDQVTDPNVLSEEVSFKLTAPANPHSLELNAQGANRIQPVQLTASNWTNVGAGQSWRRPLR
jgi:hypothetical protein